MIAIMNMNVIRPTFPYCGCCPPALGIRLLLLLLYPVGIMSFSSLLSHDVAGTPYSYQDVKFCLECLEYGSCISWYNNTINTVYFNDNNRTD